MAVAEFLKDVNLAALGLVVVPVVPVVGQQEEEGD